MASVLRVGIIGASAERGWASISHVPAVSSLHGLELAAVSSGNQAKSDAAAVKFGARRAHRSGFDLIEDPEVDIVAITVKVPDHRDLVLAAASAGKHIYCEWPLAVNLEEAEELAKAVESTGVVNVIGLQTRMNPALQRARRELQHGAIGRVLSARIVSTALAFGPEVEEALIFAEDPRNGTTLVTIQGGHTFDTSIALLGSFENISALVSTQYSEIVVGKERKSRQRTTADHLLAQVRLSTGAPLGLEVAGGRLEDAVPFTFELIGDRGTLALEGGAPRGFQSGKLQLFVNGKTQPVDEGELVSVPENAYNVAGVYAALRDDIASGKRTVPDFRHAVRLTRLMNDVLGSSEDGSRRVASEWPQQDAPHLPEASSISTAS